MRVRATLFTSLALLSGALHPSAQETAAPTPAPVVAAAPAPSPTPAAPTAEASFKNGFLLRTPDGRNELKLGGSIHFDARAYSGDSVAPDSFDIRAARLDLAGRLNGWMELRLQAAFEDNPYLRDAWLDMRLAEPLHVRVGQMKVPFSTEWITGTNDVNFFERSTEAPFIAYFDRGVLLWGDLADRRLTYQVGAFNGSGIETDSSRGDIDDHKDVSARLFVKPFRASGSSWARGLNLVLEGTYGSQSVTTRRFETRGLVVPTYESLGWRWRGDQVLGTDGRSTDQVAATIDSRQRLGAEVAWIKGPFTASFEWREVEYEGIDLYHDFWVGSRRALHEPVLARDGGSRHVSGWVSLFLTGEEKSVEAFGWKQPDPKQPFTPGGEGLGAWELLARVSRTDTDLQLFDTARVDGYTAEQLAGVSGAQPVADGSSLSAAVLQGADEIWEATLELNWTVNRNLRVQLAGTTVWAPNFDEGGGGILSGANSDLSDRTQVATPVERETAVLLRFMFRI